MTDPAQPPSPAGSRTDVAAGFPVEAARRLVGTALDEHLGPDGLDVTSAATIPADQVAPGHVVAPGPGVLAGGPVIDLVLDGVGSRTGGTSPSLEVRIDDGARIDAGDVIATVDGPVRQVLMSERTLLNVMSRLSGVATHTRRWVDVAAEYAATGIDYFSVGGLTHSSPTIDLALDLV